MRYTTGNLKNNRINTDKILKFCKENKIQISNYEFLNGELNSPKVDLPNITKLQYKQILELYNESK